MRVLHIIDYYGPAGGLHKFLLLQKEALERYGVEQYYLATQVPPFIQHNLENEYRVIDLPKENRPLKQILSSVSPDIINVHLPFYEKDMLYCLNNYTCIATIHNNNLFCPFAQFHKGEVCHTIISNNCVEKGCITTEEYMKAKQQIKIYQQFDGIAYLSPSVGNKLISCGIEKERIYKIPSLIKKRNINISCDNANILFVGRLIEQKGLEYVIDALYILKDTNWHFYVAGTGDLMYIRKLIDKVNNYGLQERVSFLGNLNEEQLEKYISLSRMMIFSSIGPETYGYSGAEAISYGIPVIAFDVDGIEAWLYDEVNGYKVPVGNSKALSEKIEILLKDNQIYNNIRANIAKINQSYNRKKAQDELFFFYNKFYKGV